MSDTPESATNASPPVADAKRTPQPRDRILLVVFWAWALVLVVATLAQLFGWQGVLDVLDVKRWFSR